MLIDEVILFQLIFLLLPHKSIIIYLINVSIIQLKINNYSNSSQFNTC